MQDILDNFEFRNQIPRLSRADALGTLIEMLTRTRHQPEPRPGAPRRGLGQASRPRQPRHGTIFKELVRRLNEQNNEEAGEHCAPRHAVRLTDASGVLAPIRGR